MSRDQWRRRGRLALIDLLTLDVLPTSQRVKILRRLGAQIGAEPELYAARFVSPENLRLGDRVFVNYDCFLEAREPITLGTDVALAPRVTILTTTHEPGEQHRRAGWVRGYPVAVGDGTWIGAAATLLPGVTVGAGCIIAAGAVVTADCEPNSVYAGIPAKKVKALTAAEA